MQSFRIKSRVDGESPERVRIKALTRRALRALSGEEEHEIPILVGPEDKWLCDEQQNLATIAPMELPLDYIWNWINEEATRAAVFWLIDFP